MRLIAMYPAVPEALQLAMRLRQLRAQHWPEARLTQARLAKAFSAEEVVASVTVASWESRTMPKLPPAHRLRAYARFFATQRSVASEPKLLPLAELTSDEMDSYRRLETELLYLRDAANRDSREDYTSFSRFWRFPDNGRITLVYGQLVEQETGSICNPSNPYYTELRTCADLDSLLELHGHIRAENPMKLVCHVTPSAMIADDLTGHIVLVGGAAESDMIVGLSEMIRLPVRRVGDYKTSTAGFFIADLGSKESHFRPKFAGGDSELLVEDVGFLARVPNPLNASKTLTLCSGAYSHGAHGAARSLTDAELRSSNERYISSTFGNGESFAILMSVYVVNNRVLTPDFNSEGVVLYQWRP
jgi:hypothetical protein